MKRLTKKEMKEHVITRMDYLCLPYRITDAFVRHGKIARSTMHGMLRWITEGEQDLVDIIEKKYKVMVYHVVEGAGISGKYEYAFLCCFYDQSEQAQEARNRGWVMACIMEPGKSEDFRCDTVHLLKTANGGLDRDI